MCKLSKYEQETIFNFNAEEPNATVYTRDKAVMRRLDALVTEFPEVFQCIGETDIDKTYSLPKSRDKYRRPRRISEKVKEQRREMMQKINNHKLWMFLLQMFHAEYIIFLGGVC